jgi:hypothetical protein
MIKRTFKKAILQHTAIQYGFDEDIVMGLTGNKYVGPKHRRVSNGFLIFGHVQVSTRTLIAQGGLTTTIYDSIEMEILNNEIEFGEFHTDSKQWSIWEAGEVGVDIKIKEWKAFECDACELNLVFDGFTVSNMSLQSDEVMDGIHYMRLSKKITKDQRLTEPYKSLFQLEY